MQHSQNELTLNLTMNQPFTPVMNLMNILSKNIQSRKVQTQKTVFSCIFLHFCEKGFKGSKGSTRVI